MLLLKFTLIVWNFFLLLTSSHRVSSKSSPRPLSCRHVCPHSPDTYLSLNSDPSYFSWGLSVLLTVLGPSSHIVDRSARQALPRIPAWNQEMFSTSYVAMGVKLWHSLESQKEATENSGKLENIFQYYSLYLSKAFQHFQKILQSITSHWLFCMLYLAWRNSCPYILYELKY